MYTRSYILKAEIAGDDLALAEIINAERDDLGCKINIPGLVEASMNNIMLLGTNDGKQIY